MIIFNTSESFFFDYLKDNTNIIITIICDIIRTDRKTIFVTYILPYKVAYFENNACFIFFIILKKGNNTSLYVSY